MKVVIGVVVGVVAGLVLLVGAAAGVVGGLVGGGTSCHARVTDPATTPAGLSVEQATNARLIVVVGQRLGVPARGWVIAVATALQESDLINSGTATDHDSLGLFQQRPSQGWGTPEQIMNPEYAATAFYQRLLRVPNWLNLPLTRAAQAVQRSAYPDAYATHEPQAAAIVAVYTGGVVCDGGEGPTASDLAALPAGYSLPADTPLPVVVAVRWALAQVGTPYTYGGDCAAPHSGVPEHQCDCSSLVQQAYATAGQRIPRVTTDQVHTGTPVAGLTDLRPGDLIFIPGSGGSLDQPHHVGMALGDGLVIQAPTTGDVVKISHVSSWANQIAAIRRIVPVP